MYETKTEWFIIVNPHAGSGKTMSDWTEAAKRLRERGVPFTSEFTRYKSHARELALQAARDGYRRFLAAGGDGSVHELFSGVLDFCLESGVPPEEFLLGNIPIGSGNDWIKSLGVPHDIDKVVELVAAGACRKQDVVTVRTADGRTCCMANVGGTGFDSHVCERVNARKERGHRSKWIYIGALVATILKLKRLNVEVTGNGEVLYSGPCYSVAFGNGPYSGGGMRQAAAAVMDDGLVDVMIVPVISLFRILREAHRLFDGTTPQSQYLVYRQCREITVTPLDPRSGAHTDPRSGAPADPRSGAPADPRSAASLSSSFASSAVSRPASSAVSRPGSSTVSSFASSAVSRPASPAVSRPGSSTVSSFASSAVSRPASPAVSSFASFTGSRPASSTGSWFSDPKGSLFGDLLEVDGEIEGRLPATVTATSLRIGVVAPQP